MKLLTYEMHLLRKNLLNLTKCIKLPYVCQAIFSTTLPAPGTAAWAG